MSRYNHRIFPVFSFPKLLTVNCYLLSEPQIVFGNCQLSTVTLGIDDIDLSCDMMKNKPQKTWNISLLFVYLQRTMVQIQKLIFHILKDFKEAVCEYRLFFYFLRSVSFLDFSSNVNVIDQFLWHPKKNKPQKIWNISLLFVYLQRKHRPELLKQDFCNSNFL